MTEWEQAENLTKQPAVSRLYLISDESSVRAEMNSRPMRLLALLLLMCMIAAQVHVCFEASGAQRSQHQCQVCKSGSWAVPVPDTSLDAQVVSNPLQDELVPCLVRYAPIDATSSRAPPQI